MDAVDAVDAIDCCFSELGSTGSVDTGADCPPPARPFVVFVFAVFKVNISSSLGVAAAALALTVCCVDCVEEGLELALTIEAQEFIECSTGMRAIN